MKRMLLVCALVGAILVPAAMAADPTPADFKNAAKYCKAVRESKGVEAFARPRPVDTEKGVTEVSERWRRVFERNQDGFLFARGKRDHARPEPERGHEPGCQRRLDKPSKLQNQPVINRNATQQHRSSAPQPAFPCLTTAKRS
jgi:hypothetical protein